jgi:hypothetical protein
VRLVIEGHHLPGRSYGTYDDIHVGVPDPARAEVIARVDLTDEQGMPRGARLRPALSWA